MATAFKIKHGLEARTYRSAAVTSTTGTLDLSTGNTFALDLANSTTITFTNPPPSGYLCAFVVRVTGHTGTPTISWPNSVVWSGGVTPAAMGNPPNDKEDLYVLMTVDGGSTYYGRRVWEEVA